MRPLFDRLWDLQLGRCWICCKPMTMRAPHLDRKGATIDHLVPLSRGGANKPRNKLLAHSSCNGKRDNPQVWTPTSVLRKLALQRLADVASKPDLHAVSTSAISQGTGRDRSARQAAVLPAKARPLSFPLEAQWPST